MNVPGPYIMLVPAPVLALGVHCTAGWKFASITVHCLTLLAVILAGKRVTKFVDILRRRILLHVLLWPFFVYKNSRIA